MLVTPIRYDRHMMQIAASEIPSGISTDQLPFGVPCQDESSVWRGAQKTEWLTGLETKTWPSIHGTALCFRSIPILFGVFGLKRFKPNVKVIC